MTIPVIFAILFCLGVLAEVALACVLLARKQYKSFPIFCVYITFNLLVDISLFSLSGAAHLAAAIKLALFLLPVQYLLELAVLLEIAWHLIKPVHSSLPRAFLKFFALMAVVALGTGALIAWRANSHAADASTIKFKLDLTVGVLRIMLFLLTAGFAQMLGIGWKDKVLQLATGFCAYSALDLSGSLLQSHQGPSMTANLMKVAAYLIELTFFLWAFTTKEAERREFSPQMQAFLVRMSQRARDTRAAIVRSQVK